MPALLTSDGCRLTVGDGDGWVTCALGHRHWGRYGAAGLLLRTADEVVLQHRAAWSHHGDTWGMPGGARDSHESDATAALREAAEEAALDRADVLVTGVHTVDHGGWSYATVLARPLRPVVPVAANAESVAVAWHRIDDVPALPLHPGFADAWPTVRDIGLPPVLVVDSANVVGSRPDGWWRDRLGATATLYDGLRRWLEGGVGPGVLPGDVSTHTRRFATAVLVVEGAAGTLPDAADPRVEVVRAPGSGDDTVVDVLRRTPSAVVVTADRALRARAAEYGATAAGPRWLLAELARAAG